MDSSHYKVNDRSGVPQASAASSAMVGEITTAITEIDNQTSLPALHASPEEMRKLARQISQPQKPAETFACKLSKPLIHYSL